jgi:hypothetical protein
MATKSKSSAAKLAEKKPTKVAQPSKAMLKKTLKVLQKAHDHIEQFGFDIRTYNPGGYSLTTLQGPCCFIGTARVAAGCKRLDPFNGLIGVDTTSGNGPELEWVLKVLDESAEKIPRKGVKKNNIIKELEKDFGIGNIFPPGRFVERIGLALQGIDMNRPRIMSEGEIEEYALTIFRRAIRDVTKQINA